MVKCFSFAADASKTEPMETSAASADKHVTDDEKRTTLSLIDLWACTLDLPAVAVITSHIYM